MTKPDAGGHGPFRARELSAASKMSSTRSIWTCCRHDTPSAMPALGAVPSRWLADNSLIDGAAAGRSLLPQPRPTCSRDEYR